MGAVLLAAGHKGRRYALPHARMMIHQPLGGARGQATDIEIQAREIKKMKETLIDILVDATGKNRDELAQGHRARLLPVRGPGQGVRPHRRGAAEADQDRADGLIGSWRRTRDGAAPAGRSGRDCEGSGPSRSRSAPSAIGFVSLRG